MFSTPETMDDHFWETITRHQNNHDDDMIPFVQDKIFGPVKYLHLLEKIAKERK